MRWLAEELEPVQTGAFSLGSAKGMVADELAAMAAVLREACPLPCARPDRAMVDTCVPVVTVQTPSTFPRRSPSPPPPVALMWQSTATAAPAAKLFR